MKINKKAVLYLFSLYILLGCTNKDHVNQLENETKINKQIQEYIQIRKEVISSHSNKIFGIGLGTSYNDIQILLNPSLSTINSNLYEDDIDHMDILIEVGEDSAKVEPLHSFTKSYLFNKDIDTENFNYQIYPIKPSQPFKKYEAKISKKYGVCALSGNYFSNRASEGIINRSDIYNQIENIVYVLNQRYQLKNIAVSPENLLTNSYSNGVLIGDWYNNDMDIKLFGLFSQLNGGKVMEHIKIEYLSKDSNCHEDVENELYKIKKDDDDLNSIKIEKNKIKALKESPL